MSKRLKTRGGLSPDKYLTKEQIITLREYTKAQANLAKGYGKHRAVMNEMIVDILLNSGLRATELCQLQMRDIPHYHGKLVIDVRQGKGCVRRSVEISSALADRIRCFVKSHRKNSKPKSPLFVNEHGCTFSYASLYSKLHIIGRAAGTGRLTAHMLRHTYATMLYNQTKDLLFIGDQLGHRDPQTTAIYARTNSEERRRMAENFDL